MALGGVDPPPSTNELALGGLDHPPSTSDLVRGWRQGGVGGDFSAPSARLSTTTTFHKNITMVLKAEVNFSEWWSGLGFVPQTRRIFLVWVMSDFNSWLPYPS